jgi:hypothetical protein
LREEAYEAGQRRTQRESRGRSIRRCRGSRLDRAKAVRLDVMAIWKDKASAMIAKRKAAEFLNVPFTVP